MMTGKLDLKDRKIFYLLTENSRMKTSEIATRVGLSKNAVKYRIGKLIAEGYARKLFAVTDLQKIGVYSNDLFLRINLTPEKEERIVKYFSDHPNVIWAALLFGEYDVYAQIAAKNLEEFSHVLDDILVFLGKDLETYEVRFPVKRIKIDENIFDYEKETGYRFRQKKPDYSTIIKLDETDKKILRHLSVNGVTPYSDIAKALGLSLETARNRIIALIKNGVVIKHKPFIGYDKFGLDMYFVFVTFRYLTKEMKEKVSRYTQHNKDIKIAFETLGKQEIYFLATVNGSAELGKIMNDIRSRFYDNVLGVRHMLIKKDFKLDFFPEALMEL